MNSSIINDEKPRVILNEYSVSKNIPKCETALDRKCTADIYKKHLKIVIVRYEGNEMEFDLVGLHPALANTFRRIMLSEVPTMAIEKVHIYNNTSVIQDEVLSHRLGLIPLKADPRLFEMKSNPYADGTEIDTLEFELKIKCSLNKDANKESSRADDLFKNNNVYSKHIKWIPKGKQGEMYKEFEIGPIYDDILIAKMRPGHEIDLKMEAIKSIGQDHAKFSPVSTAYYRLLPEIHLTREVTGEQAERLAKCFAPGVIGVRHKDGKKVAFVNDARYDISSRNVYRYEDLKDAVILSKIEDHFIFNVESVGALKPDVIFSEAVNQLKNKCLGLLEELAAL